MSNIPNGSIINFFTSGGQNHGPRFEIVKAAPPRATAIKPEDTKRFRLTEQLDPARIYAARRVDHKAEDRPAKAPESTLDASSIYAARSAHV